VRSRLASALLPVAASVALALTGLVSRPAAAQVSLVDDPSELAFGAGGYNIFHQIYNAAVFRGEYRFGDKLFFLRPIIGGEVTTQGSAYGYGGFSAEIGIGNFIIIPSAAVGFWERGGRSKPLGSFIEFRTGAELDYRFEDDTRIGISLHHISNAGLTKENPGVEEALLVYSFPFGFGP